MSIGTSGFLPIWHMPAEAPGVYQIGPFLPKYQEFTDMAHTCQSIGGLPNWLAPWEHWVRISFGCFCFRWTADLPPPPPGVFFHLLRHLYPHHTALLVDTAALEPFSHQIVLMMLGVL